MGKKDVRSSSREERSEVINFRVTPKEKALIERLAKKEDVPVSGYIRGSVLMDMLTSGDAEAMMYAMGMIGGGLKQMARSAVFGSELKEPVVA